MRPRAIQLGAALRLEAAAETKGGELRRWPGV
jgi:hypothetical protein